MIRGMRSWRLSVLLFVLLLASCTSDATPSYAPSMAAVCQSGLSCCSADQLVCRGDPDQSMVCTCFKAWTCDAGFDPHKCWQRLADVPDNRGNWTCRSEGASEQCTRPGRETPPPKNGWTCRGIGDHVECTRATNVPSGAGSWICSYAGDVKTCVPGTPTQDLGGPVLDGSSSPRHDGATSDAGTTPALPDWECEKNAIDETICRKQGSGVPPEGLPGGGGSFHCDWTEMEIVCEGTSPTPPRSGEWTCSDEAASTWRCTKPAGPGDFPPGSGTWSCTSGTPQGGTVCRQAPLDDPPATSKECTPGQKMWCDGNAYCGWGQATCGPDGRWGRTLDPQTGKETLDCAELPDGGRPNTVCACYYATFNADCCEQPDCIVLSDTPPQLCPQSAGEFCDYCTPSNPECQGEGAKCVVTTSSEAFCGQDCSMDKNCPEGASCREVEVGGEMSWQCVPDDLSCYR